MRVFFFPSPSLFPFCFFGALCRFNNTFELPDTPPMGEHKGQDELEDGKMRFDYRLWPGVVTRSNALELMRAVGLEV